MSYLNKKTLVLNSDGSAIAIIRCQDAVTLQFKNADDPNKGAVVIDFYKGEDDYILGTKDRKYQIPLIVILPHFKKMERALPFSRKNVFLRDMMTCQYCGRRFQSRQLTFDHVIPRSQWDWRHGSPTVFTNIVSCCYPCNRRKGSKTPEQAKMPLLKEPVEPSPHGFVLGLSPWTHVEEERKPLLPRKYKAMLEFENGY